MKELIEKLEELSELTKDYNKFIHLFSEDDGKKTLAKIRETVGKIRLRIDFSLIKEIGHPGGKPLKEVRESGKFVKIRPCGEEFEDKTYLGVLIGDAALSSSIGINDEKIVCSWAFFNPAILIPELGKIVYGCESWWGLIRSEDDLKSITDIDIENVWYVKAMKTLSKETAP